MAVTWHLVSNPVVTNGVSKCAGTHWLGDCERNCEYVVVYDAMKPTMFYATPLLYVY